MRMLLTKTDVKIRNAARTGRFEDLPEWVKNKVNRYYYRLHNISKPTGLLM